MRVLLQGRTPYPRSLKWKIHTDYYLRRGLAAWLSGEVPSDVTSNPRAAYQNALMVYRAVEQLYPKQIPRGEKIYVLEIAAGLGSFCLNFILQFEQICKSHNKKYHQNLVYLMTDLGRHSLKDAAANPHLQKMHKSGRLLFASLDALRPNNIRLIDGRRFVLRRNQLMGVVANYAMCCLQQTVLKKDGDKYFEKNIALWFDSPKVKNRRQALRLLGDPEQHNILQRVEEVSEYRPIKLHRFAKEEAAQNALLATTRTLDTAHFVYPSGPMKCIERLLPYVHTGGVILINDKGYPRALEMARDYFAVPSFHGNSFAHHLNTPILEQYARGIGYAAERTADVHYSIQTLLLYRGSKMPDALKREFRETFVSKNLNQLTMGWIMAARDYLALQDFETALYYILLAKKVRSEDYLVHWRLGTCYLQLGQYKKAIAHLRLGEKLDYFNRYDFVGELEKVNEALARGAHRPLV